MYERNFTITLSLSSLPDDATLEVSLPPEGLQLKIGMLLEEIFPVEEETFSIFESFDVEENPDLPEIYEEFQRVIDQHRMELCDLLLTDDSGINLDFYTSVDALFSSQETTVRTGPPSWSLVLTPQYDALAYAATRGYVGQETDFVLWLQVCLAIYFLDKHETPLPAPGELVSGDPLKPVVEEIGRLGLVQWPEGPGCSEITPQGRRFIGALLAETEEIIDRYDMLNDTVWDEETQEVFFETGRGEDLRVEAFIMEGIDPVRAVFLLRLYDGTVDGCSDQRPDMIDDEEFLNFILEPVVNRTVVPEAMVEAALDESMALLEAAGEEATKQRARQRVAWRVISGQP